MGIVWKGLEMQDKEALECCKQSLIDNSGISSLAQNSHRNAFNKDHANEVSVEMRTLLGNGLEAIHITFWQRTYLKFDYVLRLCVIEFKGLIWWRKFQGSTALKW